MEQVLEGLLVVCYCSHSCWAELGQLIDLLHLDRKYLHLFGSHCYIMNKECNWKSENPFFLRTQALTFSFKRQFFNVFINIKKQKFFRKCLIYPQLVVMWKLKISFWLEKLEYGSSAVNHGRQEEDKEEIDKAAAHPDRNVDSKVLINIQE